MSEDGYIRISIEDMKSLLQFATGNFYGDIVRLEYILSLIREIEYKIGEKLI